jgi:dimethylargininase
MLALTHSPSPQMAECLLTFVERTAIDQERVLRQHAAYCDALRDGGADVRVLDVNCAFPDCAFIEDTAVVLDEVALLARPATAVRRAETAGIEGELQKFRQIEHVFAPAILEGGDVLRVGQTLMVGLSSRTSLAGAAALDSVAGRYGYNVRTVPVRGCLHLKTACTALPDRRLVVNPEWLDVRALGGFELIPVPAGEPWGANVVCLGDRIIAAAEHVETADLIRNLGFDLCTVDLGEFAKAEGGATCLSLLVG